MSTDAETAPKGETETPETEAPPTKTLKASTPPAFDDIFDNGEAEAERRNQFRELAASFVADHPEMSSQAKEIVTTALEAGWETNKLETHLQRLRHRAPAGIAIAGRGAGPEPQEVTEAALCMSASRFR